MRKLAPELERTMLEEYRLRFKSGRRSDLFAALRFCMNQEILPPEWLTQAFFDATNAWYSMQAKTLDEAFGVAWPKGKSFEAARKKRKLKYVVSHQIHEAAQRGRPIDEELFEEIGARLGIGKTLVKQYYQSVRSAWVPAIPGALLEPYTVPPDNVFQKAKRRISRVRAVRPQKRRK